MKDIKNIDYYARFFLYTAFILFFISLFFPWEITTYFLTNEIIDIHYGYEFIAHLFLIVSLIPILLFHVKFKGIIFYIFIPLIELFFLGSFIRVMGIPEYNYRLGYGYYLAILGVIYQFIGIVITIDVINNLKKEEKMRGFTPKCSNK